MRESNGQFHSGELGQRDGCPDDQAGSHSDSHSTFADRHQRVFDKAHRYSF
jgi:hypothetical protein